MVAATAALVASGSAQTPPQAPAPVSLPALRDELRIMPTSANADGSPAWVIQDPVRNRFFRIGWLDFEMLLQWEIGDADTVVKAIQQQTILSPSRDNVIRFMQFLTDNELVRLADEKSVQQLQAKHERKKQSIWLWVLHHYLFFRVPLVRPQQWLASTAPYLSWIQTRATAYVVLGLSALGIYLVSRQWDVFTHTFVDHLTFTGILGYAVALAIAKSFHELGHAYRATHHGVRVAHMGVAFLVMFPMLYTDTGESWRLKAPQHRLSIASAGIVVELAIAGLATLAWAVTPDGALRNGLFFLATISWAMTLAINASPFMRFDGYFIASDLVDIPNLHERSGALAKVWMRHVLLGWPLSWPEEFSRTRRKLLIGFALITWGYRLVLFLGIALLVYHFFFKVLGIFLMLVELVWFIGRPVWQEMKVWQTGRKQIKRSRWWGALALLVISGFLLFLPLSTTIRADGWLRAEQQQMLFSPFAAQVTELPKEKVVKRGQVMMSLDSQDLGFEQQRALQLANAREKQMKDLMGLPDGERQRSVLASEKSMFEAQARASKEQRGRLSLQAPFDGVLWDMDTEIEIGTWVKPQQGLAWLVNPNKWVVDAYVVETDLARLQPGQAVRIRQLVTPAQWLEGKVQEMDVSRTTVLPTPMLDARHGGPIAVLDGKESPSSASNLRDALYRVRIELAKPPSQQRMSLVRVQIEGAPESLAGQFMRQAASVLVRESGF
jgi:putative peptide zinc metalloprotease protein